jgi:hypothetical protein
MQWLQNTINLEIDISSYCNARCPCCARTQNLEKIPVTHFDFDVWRRLWYSDLIDQNIYRLEFNGNWGDPLMHPDIIPMLKIVKEVKPNIQLVVNTNGGLRSKEFWKDFAILLSNNFKRYRVNFGIDGTTQKSHEIYRVDVELEKVLENAKVFNDNGGVGTWQMTIFDHNVDEIPTAIEMAEDYGFSSIWFRKSYTRTVWNANSEIVATTNCYDNRPVHDLFFTRRFKPSSAPDTGLPNPHPCKYFNKRSIQIDPYHNIWPCCHISGKLYDTEHMDVLQDSWQKYGYKCNSLEKYTYQEILESDYFVKEIQDALDTAKWQPCRSVCGIK